MLSKIILILISSVNPRDSLMPKDGDDGFYPTTGNELVSTPFIG